MSVQESAATSPRRESLWFVRTAEERRLIVAAAALVGLPAETYVRETVNETVLRDLSHAR